MNAQQTFCSLLQAWLSNGHSELTPYETLLARAEFAQSSISQRTKRFLLMQQLRTLGLQCDARIKRFPRHVSSTASSRNRRRRRVQDSSGRPNSVNLRRRALPAGKSNADSSSQRPQTDVYSWKQKLPGDSGWDLFKLRKTDTKTFNRFREVEVIHARWAMLGVLALLLGDVSGSPTAPKHWTFASLAPWGFVLLSFLALIETYRLAALWGEEDVDKRVYPGKRFDVLGLTRRRQQQSDEPPAMAVFASWLGGVPGWLAGGWWFDRRDMTEAELMDMQSRELRNGRLAMVSFIGCCMATAATGKGPITLLVQHIADPVHNTIVQTLQ